MTIDDEKPTAADFRNSWRAAIRSAAISDLEAGRAISKRERRERRRLWLAVAVWLVCAIALLVVESAWPAELRSTTAVRADGSVARYSWRVHEDGSLEIVRSEYEFRFEGIPAALAPAIEAEGGTTEPLEPLPFEDVARVRFVPDPVEEVER